MIGTTLAKPISRILKSSLLALSLSSMASWAVPVTWTLNNVTAGAAAPFTPITGSFTYDADTNVYSNINLTANGINYTIPFGGPASASNPVFAASPLQLNQNVVAFKFNPALNLNNAGGTRTLRRNSDGLAKCTNAACTTGSWGDGAYSPVQSGTLTGVASVGTQSVPTLGEWGLMLLISLMGYFGLRARRQVR